MPTRRLIAVLVAAAVTWSVTAAAAAAENEKEEGDNNDAAEVRLKLDQVPDAVRESLLKEAAGAKFDGVEREFEDGKTVYEIAVVIDGKTWGIEVDETGKLLERELEDAEDQDDAADDDDGKKQDADHAVEAKKDAKDNAGEDDAAAAAKNKDDDAEGDDDAADDEGETEEAVTLDQLPAAVKKALTQAAGKGRIGEIEKETEDGRTVYEAEVTVDGKTWEITFGADGKVLEKELDDDGDKDEADDD